MPTHCVYVIELEPTVREIGAFRARNPSARSGKPCVYVGCTAHDPQVRLEQHMAGIRANRFVRRFGVRLRPGIMRFLEGYPT